MPRGRFQTIARLANTLPPRPLEEAIPPINPPKLERSWAGYKITLLLTDYAIQEITLGDGQFQGRLVLADQAEQTVSLGDSLYENVPIELADEATQGVHLGHGRNMVTRVLSDAATQQVTLGDGDHSPRIPLGDAAHQSLEMSGRNDATLDLTEQVLQGIEDGPGVYAVFLFVGDQASHQVGSPSGEHPATLAVEEAVRSQLDDGPGEYGGNVAVIESANQAVTVADSELAGTLALSDHGAQQASAGEGDYFDDTPIWEGGDSLPPPALASNYYWGLTYPQNPNLILTEDQVSWHVQMFEIEKLIFQGTQPSAVFGPSTWIYQSGLGGGAYSALQKMPNLNPGDSATNHEVVFSIGATLAAEYTL